MPPTAHAQAVPNDAAHAQGGHGMACMEVWGGNTPADTAVSTPGIDAFVYSRPYQSAGEGGDIHYVSLCASGRIARFAVADVSGHGAEVSEIAGQLRGMMRRHVNNPNQARFASDLNASFSQTELGGRFATAILATYWSPTDHLIVCNAGHPRPMWYRAKEDRWQVMSEDSGLGAGRAEETGIRNLPLGIIEPTDYTQSAYALDPGDLVLIYTDALNEAADASGTQLGEQGLLSLCGSINAADPAGFIPALLDKVRMHRGGAELDDDVTLLLLHHNGAEPPRYSLRERAAMIGRLLGLVE